MTFASIETSVQGGKPVDLYRIIAGETVVPRVVEPIDGNTFERPIPAPAPPGALVVPWYTPADDLGLSSDTAVDGPACVLGVSHFESTIPGNVAVCCAAHNGGIAEVGHYFRSFKYTADHGLEASHTYIVRALLGYRTPQPFAHGIRFGGTFDAGAEDALAYVDFPVTSSGGAEIAFEFGHYDMPSSYANIVYLGGLAIFDPETPSENPTDGGIPGLAIGDFTSADLPIVFQGATFTPAIIIRGPLRYSDEETRSMDLVLEIPRDHAIVELAGRRAPAPPAICRIYQVHRSDLTVFMGPHLAQVSRCEKVGAKARLTLTPITSLFELELPVLVTEKKCPLALYGPICQASRQGHEFFGLEVTAVEGRIVTIDGLGALAGEHATRFTEGVLTGPDGSRSTIEAFDAGGPTPDVLELYAANPALTVGSIVDVLDGCLKDVGTCNTLFDNLPRHGGEPLMPTRNLGTGAGLG